MLTLESSHEFLGETVFELGFGVVATVIEDIDDMTRYLELIEGF